MGQLVGCMRGIGEASRALDFPVVSGNVSLYNETNGQAILPTPTIGGVGLLDDFTKSMTLAFKAEGEAILLDRRNARLARPVALFARHLRPRGGRAAAGRSCRRAAQWRFRPRADPRGAAHRGARISDGGLLVALAEMAIAGGIGAVLGGAGRPRRPAFWFGEDQARYVVTVPAANADDDCSARPKAAQVPMRRLGATGGRVLALAGERPLRVEDLRARFEDWLPAYMAGRLRPSAH